MSINIMSLLYVIFILLSVYIFVGAIINVYFARKEEHYSKLIKAAGKFIEEMDNHAKRGSSRQSN